MSCHFYGVRAYPKFGLLFESGGNQCGLVTTKVSPCRMEMQGQHCDFKLCELNGTGRAEEYRDWPRIWSYQIVEGEKA